MYTVIYSSFLQHCEILTIKFRHIYIFRSKLFLKYNYLRNFPNKCKHGVGTIKVLCLTCEVEITLSFQKLAYVYYDGWAMFTFFLLRKKYGPLADRVMFVHLRISVFRSVCEIPYTF